MLLDEIKEKYEESAKLINLRTLALIRAGRLDEGMKLSNKLVAAMNAKETLFDKIELEMSLSFQAIILTSLGKPIEKENTLKILKETNEHSFLMKELNKTEQNLQNLK